MPSATTIFETINRSNNDKNTRHRIKGGKNRAIHVGEARGKDARVSNRGSGWRRDSIAIYLIDDAFREG